MTRPLLTALSLIVSTLASPGPAAAAPTPPRPKVISTPAPKPAQPTEDKPRRRPAAKPAASLVAAYMPKVKAALGEKWQEIVGPHATEFSAGQLSVTFTLDAEGKVLEFAIVKNTSDDALAKAGEQVVRAAVFEKPPEKALKEGKLEIPFTFSIY